jgi:hypothetical protein
MAIPGRKVENMADSSIIWERIKQQLHTKAWRTQKDIRPDINEADEEVLRALAFDYLRYLANQFASIHQQQCLSTVTTLERVFDKKPGFACFSRELWRNPVCHTLEFLALYDEEMNQKMEQLAWYEPEFSIVLNPEASAQTIYFLYDAVDAPRDFDNHLGRIMPVNGGSVHFHRDYHLPIYLMVQKQFPGRRVVLTSIKEEIPNQYIYPLTFNYFKSYIQKHPGRPLPQIRQDVLEDCRAGKAIVLLNDLHESADYSGLFSAFSKQLKEKGLIDNTFILSGDLANQTKYQAWLQSRFILKNLFQERKPLPFYCFRYFESAVAEVFSSRFPDFTFDKKVESWLEHRSKIKHFLCYNRVVKDFRVTASFLFYKNRLLDKTLISQNEIDNNLAFSFGHNQHKSLLGLLDDADFDSFRKSLPWLVDTQSLTINHWDTIDLKTVTQAFIWVITETAFGKEWPEMASFLTEKTYKPMACLMPFIMIGPPGSLRTLREEGYLTFSEWWDEGYDDIEDPKARMLKIFELITAISHWPIAKVEATLFEMRTTLEYNSAHLLRRRAQLPFITALMERYDAIA